MSNVVAWRNHLTGPSLEALGFKYGSDKSKDDHKYVDLYAALFDSIRDRVTNVTELGFAKGHSLDMWLDYFPAARIWGVDVNKGHIVQRRFKHKPRVSLIQADLYRATTTPRSIGLEDESMDVVIDDVGMHEQEHQEIVLHRYWRRVRPGGFYIIEDVEWDRADEARGGSATPGGRISPCRTPS